MSNRFVFVVPCYNAEKTIEKMLQSVFMQTYENWLILIRDDMSTDNTLDKIYDVCCSSGVDLQVIEDEEDYVGPGKVYLWANTEKFWEIRNVLEMIKSDYVKEDDIICRLDGDDFLSDLYALEDIDLIYRKSGADVVYSGHAWTGTEQIVDHGNNIMSVNRQNISAPYPAGADPYDHPWVTSHFKTFRKDLLDDVKDENFRAADGEYFKRIGDQVIMLPALKNAEKVVFFPKSIYSYNIDVKPETFASDDAKFQKSEAIYLRQRGYV